MNYYLFRICYDDWIGGNFATVRGELLQGRLRQGWGQPGMDIRNFSNQNAFVSACIQKYGGNNVRRYNRLFDMIKIDIDDLIVIPKVSIYTPHVGRYFTVAKCTE